MTRKNRLKSLQQKLHDPSQCETCHGTGIDPHGRRRNGKPAPCAGCFVRSTVVMVRPRDFKWLLKLAGEAVDPKCVIDLETDHKIRCESHGKTANRLTEAENRAAIAKITLSSTYGKFGS